MTTNSEDKANRKLPGADVSKERIAELKLIEPGLSTMDYRTALHYYTDLQEAAAYLRHKRQAYI